MNYCPTKDRTVSCFNETHWTKCPVTLVSPQANPAVPAVKFSDDNPTF